MGIISSLREKRSTLSEPSQELIDYFGGAQSYTGANVNSDTALSLTAVYACVRILSETVASLPLPVFKRLPDRGKTRANTHYLYKVLHDKANDEMTSFNFRETMMNHLLLWGNAYAEIEFDKGGRVRGLYPMNPAKTFPERQGGKIIYKTTLPSGEKIILPQERVFHIAGMGFNGLVGYNPIRLAREAIGLGLASEEYGARFFGNGAKPSGVLEHPHNLTDGAQKNLRTSWNEMHQGLSNQHRIAILEEGMTYKSIGIPPEEAQFLETRKFQVTEIARFFRVPPHMLADLERATFSNIEQQSIDFVTHSIRPWLVRWEQAINSKLFGVADSGKHYAEFVVEGLLRGDIKSRYEAYSIGRQNGWLSADDIRELENMNPLPDGQGEKYLIPLNMMPADQIDQIEQDERSSKKKETRALKSIETRMSISNGYQDVFKRAVERIIGKEEAKVMERIRKHLRNADTFNLWLDEFYQDHEKYIGTEMMPILSALAEVMHREASKEVGKDSEMTNEMRDFVKGYFAIFVKRHIGNSLNKLKEVLEKAINEGTDIEEAFKEQFSEWKDERAESEAKEETVRASNAFVKMAYSSLGVTMIRWVADSNPCPICKALNGKVIGIQSSFVRQGEEFNIGEGAPFKPSRNIGHAPIHKGCSCTIAAN